MKNTPFSRFEKFQHDRVLHPVRCETNKGQTCIPLFSDPLCRACEEGHAEGTSTGDDVGARRAVPGIGDAP